MSHLQHGDIEFMTIVGNQTDIRYCINGHTFRHTFFGPAQFRVDIDGSEKFIEKLTGEAVNITDEQVFEEVIDED